MFVKNTGTIKNDGESVYFESKIEISVGLKIVLIILNLLSVTFLIFIFTAIFEHKPGESRSIAPYILMPAFYIFTLGRWTIWNLFGEEHIIVNTKTIAHSKGFGFFHTSYKTIQFKKLRSQLILEKQVNNCEYGTINFFGNTQLDIPVCIFSSSICVPMETLEELNKQLDFVYCIEHLSQNKEQGINLN